MYRCCLFSFQADSKGLSLMGVGSSHEQGCREHLGCNPCDRRAPVSQLQQRYPALDFSLVSTGRLHQWYCLMAQASGSYANCLLSCITLISRPGGASPALIRSLVLVAALFGRPPLTSAMACSAQWASCSLTKPSQNLQRCHGCSAVSVLNDHVQPTQHLHRASAAQCLALCRFRMTRTLCGRRTSGRQLHSCLQGGCTSCRGSWHVLRPALLW